MRTLVDLTCQVLMQAPMTRPEAERLVAATRARVLELFPEKAETFDLILAPRFERLMREHVGPPQSRGRLLPFPKR